MSKLDRAWFDGWMVAFGVLLISLAAWEASVWTVGTGVQYVEAIVGAVMITLAIGHAYLNRE